MIPALLLDVDGVLAPFVDAAESWDDWFEGPTQYHVFLSPKQAEAVLALPAEIIWLTTWEHLANEHIGPALGWPKHKVIDRYPRSHSSSMQPRRQWWKHDGAVLWHEQNPGRPFAWVDDDHEHYPEAKKWADSLDVPTLVVCTDRDLGITRDNLADLLQFFEEVEDWPNGRAETRVGPSTI